MSEIHATAVVADGAHIGDDVSIGPYCVIGPEVTIGNGCCLKSHVNIDGFTRMGENCTIFPFASLGTQTQDLKFKGGKPGVMIGSNCSIREYVTINAATFDGDFTRVGDRCHLMAYAHIAHDCLVGNEVIMANCGTLAGHVVVEDQAIIGGLSGVHQFVRIGSMSIIGGCSKVTKDVPPYLTTDGHPLQVRGLNKIGLQRRGVDEASQKTLKQAYRLLYRSKLTVQGALDEIASTLESSPELEIFCSFVKASERGITR